LITEKIVNISATAIRCSVSTESGKVATWLDELLGHVASRLEHPAQAFTEFTLDKIVSLHTCALYTVARLESGTLYWWYELFKTELFSFKVSCLITIISIMSEEKKNKNFWKLYLNRNIF